MLNIVIPAAGTEYQNAAAWAAPTYVQNLGHSATVAVLLPQSEEPLGILKENAERFGFEIRSFPFTPTEEVKYPMQLKCRAFWHAVSFLKREEMLLIVDSDTCCCRTLTIESHLKAAILDGKIGLAPDHRDRHSKNPHEPWYLPHEERDTYVNAGVILTSSKALDLFTLFLDLSNQPQFSNPQFGDQSIINFVLGKYHRGRLHLLNSIYNDMRYRRSNAPKFIAHFAGYKTPVEKAKRLGAHHKLCARILNDCPVVPGTLSVCLAESADTR